MKTSEQQSADQHMSLPETFPPDGHILGYVKLKDGSTVRVTFHYGPPPKIGRKNRRTTKAE